MFGWFRRAPARPTEDQLRLREALEEYPQYAPPAWNPDPNFYAQAGQDYREFFFASREARLKALGGFQARFGVSSNLDDTGLMAVSAWLPRYADLFVDHLDDDHVRDAYERFASPWTGTLAGLNPIFDHYAECLWYRRTKLKWIVVRSPDWGTAVHSISGLPGGSGFDPINWMYIECRNIRNSKKRKQQRFPLSDDPTFLRSDRFYRHVISHCPPGRRSMKR